MKVAIRDLAQRLGLAADSTEARVKTALGDIDDAAFESYLAAAFPEAAEHHGLIVSTASQAPEASLREGILSASQMLGYGG